MIRNILYSLFIHSILILLIYFSFNPTPPQIEIDKTLKVAVSFVTQAGNSSSDNSPTQQPPLPTIPTEMPKPLPPEVKPKKAHPITKSKKSKPKPKKLDVVKKSKPKQEEKKFKPKEDEVKSSDSKIKEPNKKDDAKQDKEKSKLEEKKPEIKEEIKKDEKVESEKVESEKDKSDSKTDDNVKEDDIDDEENAQESQYSFTENSIENLDLLFREKFNIQTQIKRCYKKALEESGKNNTSVINAHIFISKDGFIDLDVVVFKIPPEKIKNGIEDADFTKSKETVKKALKFCSPLRNLPMDKYDIWKEIDLQFD
jgi:hypothetical protein